MNRVLNSNGSFVTVIHSDGTRVDWEFESPEEAKSAQEDLTVLNDCLEKYRANPCKGFHKAWYDSWIRICELRPKAMRYDDKGVIFDTALVKEIDIRS